MAHPSKIISVCIPTFNRAPFLRECLESFIVGANRHHISIFVSDNASADDTAAMVGELQLQCPYLHYHRNAENIGPNDNLNQAVSLADTQYCWIFSDDDAIRGDPFPDLLETLSSGAELVIINGTTYDPTLTSIVEERRVDIRENQTYTPGEHNRLLIETAFYTSFLGALVLRRQKFLDIYPSIPKNSYFPHFECCYTYIVKAKAVVIAEPIIKIRLGNSMWSQQQFEILMLNWPESVWRLGERYSVSAKQAVVPRHRISSLHHMFAARALGIYGKDTFLRHIKNHSSTSTLRKAILFLMSVFPTGVARVMFKNYLTLARPKGFRILLRELAAANA